MAACPCNRPSPCPPLATLGGGYPMRIPMRRHSRRMGTANSRTFLCQGRGPGAGYPRSPACWANTLHVRGILAGRASPEERGAHRRPRHVDRDHQQEADLQQRVALEHNRGAKLVENQHRAHRAAWQCTTSACRPVDHSPAPRNSHHRAGRYTTARCSSQAAAGSARPASAPRRPETSAPPAHIPRAVACNGSRWLSHSVCFLAGAAKPTTGVKHHRRGVVVP